MAHHSNLAETHHNQGTSSNTYMIGFWLRLGAGLFDFLALLIMLFLPWFVMGTYRYILFLKSPYVFIYLLVEGIYLITFWMWKTATPGGWLMSQRVVNFNTGKPLSFKQSIIRYVGMILSAVVFGLGFLWVLWDKNKRAWHDYMSNSGVVGDASFRSKPSDKPFNPQAVSEQVAANNH